MPQRPVIGGLICLALAATAGCAATDDRTPTAVATSSTRPVATSSVAPRTSVPVAPAPAPTPTASLIRSQFVGQWAVEIPVDNGPRPHAMGKVITDHDGVPVAYVVAPEDDLSVITDRFGLESHDYLNTINQVRRAGYPYPLYAGDTLNLSAYTVTSVGTVNGVVMHNPAPSPLPPQE